MWITELSYVSPEVSPKSFVTGVFQDQTSRRHSTQRRADLDSRSKTSVQNVLIPPCEQHSPLHQSPTQRTTSTSAAHPHPAHRPLSPRLQNDSIRVARQPERIYRWRSSSYLQDLCHQLGQRQDSAAAMGGHCTCQSCNRAGWTGNTSSQ